MAEYLAEAPVSAVEDAVQTLAGENLLRMMHTHEGAAAASMVLAYGTAKDRKAAVKAMNCAPHPHPSPGPHPHAPTPLHSLLPGSRLDQLHHCQQCEMLGPVSSAS